MSVFAISLFGKLDARGAGGPLVDLSAGKARELLCYLLLSGKQPQSREVLAEVLWRDVPGAHARKYLRQAVWQLQSALETAAPGQGGTLLSADPEWLHIASEADVWVDAVELERAYERLQAGPADEATATVLDEAVKLYRGDLLEGWYADWCIFERERFRAIYLAVLGALIDFCDRWDRCEQGVAYAMLVLRRERAHERTHRQLMRLLHRSGDRTAALRQYDRCVAAMRSELGVEPAASTRALYDDIRADRLSEAEPEAPAPPRARPATVDLPLRNGAGGRVLGSLHEVRRALDYARGVVERDIASLEDRSRPVL